MCGKVKDSLSEKQPIWRLLGVDDAKQALKSALN